MARTFPRVLSLEHNAAKARRWLVREPIVARSNCSKPSTFIIITIIIIIIIVSRLILSRLLFLWPMPPPGSTYFSLIHRTVHTPIHTPGHPFSIIHAAVPCAAATQRQLHLLSTRPSPAIPALTNAHLCTSRVAGHLKRAVPADRALFHPLSTYLYLFRVHLL